MQSPPPFEPLGGTQRSFDFRYTVFNVSARIDEGRIEVRAGVRTSAAPIERLQHLHVHRDAGRGVDELLLSYALPGGRLRRLRVFADAGEAGFESLIDALLERRPDIDIRHLERREAWALTGSRELDRWVLPGMMAVAILALAVVFMPRVLHGFDRGEARIDVSALAAGERPETRNLIVEGRAVLDAVLFADQDPERMDEPTTAWLPLVGADWRPGQPVAVLLEVRNRTRADILAVAEQTRFAGILRDIWWEGLDQRRRAAFAEQDLALAADIALVELGATPGSDLAIALGVVGLLSVMMLGVMLALRRRAKAGEHSARKIPLNRPRGPGMDDDDD